MVKDLQSRGMNGALLLGIQENRRFSPPSGVVGADPCELWRFGGVMTEDTRMCLVQMPLSN